MRDVDDKDGGNLMGNTKTFFHPDDIIKQLQQQIKDQQELIEAAVNLLSCVPINNNNIYLAGFKERLELYTQKRNHLNKTYNNQ